MSQLTIRSMTSVDESVKKSRDLGELLGKRMKKLPSDFNGSHFKRDESHSYAVERSFRAARFIFLVLFETLSKEVLCLKK